MNGNAPAFDPVNPSPEEDRDMLRGYRDAWNGHAPPPITSFAYDHGRRMATNDRAGRVDPDQAEIAARFLAKQRASRAP